MYTQARRAADAELLLPQEAGYLEVDDPVKTSSHVPQQELKKHVDVRTAENSFELSLVSAKQGEFFRFIISVFLGSVWSLSFMLHKKWYSFVVSW